MQRISREKAITTHDFVMAFFYFFIYIHYLESTNECSVFKIWITFLVITDVLLIAVLIFVIATNAKERRFYISSCHPMAVFLFAILIPPIYTSKYYCNIPIGIFYVFLPCSVALEVYKRIISFEGGISKTVNGDLIEMLLLWSFSLSFVMIYKFPFLSIIDNFINPTPLLFNIDITNLFLYLISILLWVTTKIKKRIFSESHATILLAALCFLVVFYIINLSSPELMHYRVQKGIVNNYEVMIVLTIIFCLGISALCVMLDFEWPTITLLTIVLWLPIYMFFIIANTSLTVFQNDRFMLNGQIYLDIFFIFGLLYRLFNNLIKKGMPIKILESTQYLTSPENTAKEEDFKEKMKRQINASNFHVFICYSSQDNPAIIEIVQAFKQEGISYWIDTEQISFGDFITQKIESGLQKCRYVMPCLSKNQAQSGWTKAEYASILNSEFSGHSERIVVPLKLNNCDNDDIPLLLKDKKCVSFSNTAEFSNFLKFLKS